MDNDNGGSVSGGFRGNNGPGDRPIHPLSCAWRQYVQNWDAARWLYQVSKTVGSGALRQTLVFRRPSSLPLPEAPLSEWSPPEAWSPLKARTRYSALPFAQSWMCNCTEAARCSISTQSRKASDGLRIVPAVQSSSLPDRLNAVRFDGELDSVRSVLDSRRYDSVRDCVSV